MAACHACHRPSRFSWRRPSLAARPTGRTPHLLEVALRLPHFDYADPTVVYFITMRTRQGPPPFTQATLSQDVIGAPLELQARGRVRLYAYALMPDHLHAVLSLGEGTSRLPIVLSHFKSYTTRLAWQRGWVGALWQREWYEHAIRGERELYRICEYVLANPARRGLPESWEGCCRVGTAAALPI